ncbi:ketopantoate reductase family protein [Salinisphaera sp. LB1]|uniref:ketopantoate reductase family protein n=1 Tax=Salinisphaera sp. LB1 TaxID=2183911 RepID=UPI000FED48C3|nr:2-dehydropantoate 2-reductase [Salinisphaera sp. LB1]
MTDSTATVLPDEHARWHVVGAGRMGTLAAFYLQSAGAKVTVVRPGEAHQRRVRLAFADATIRDIELDVLPPADCGPVSRLLIASKTPYSAAALARVNLVENAEVIRLQNGIGSLDGRLASGQRLIEGVTASAVMAADEATLRVVAENTTTFGGGTRPPWFDPLAAHWPRLYWADDIRPVQWRKLVVNAALNPLTAIHDVPNGALLERADLQADMRALIDEADALLARLDPRWPGDSHAAVAAVVRATAANTSSMRADVQAGATTEIDAINGWLLHRAAALDMDLPTHRRIVDCVHALEPG